jgi:hypothetical protein
MSKDQILLYDSLYEDMVVITSNVPIFSYGNEEFFEERIETSLVITTILEIQTLYAHRVSYGIVTI